MGLTELRRIDIVNEILSHVANLPRTCSNQSPFASHSRVSTASEMAMVRATLSLAVVKQARRRHAVRVDT